MMQLNETGSIHSCRAEEMRMYFKRQKKGTRLSSLSEKAMHPRRTQIRDRCRSHHRFD